MSIEDRLRELKESKDSALARQRELAAQNHQARVRESDRLVKDFDVKFKEVEEELDSILGEIASGLTAVLRKNRGERHCNYTFRVIGGTFNVVVSYISEEILIKLIYGGFTDEWTSTKNEIVLSMEDLRNEEKIEETFWLAYEHPTTSPPSFATGPDEGR